MNTLFQIDSEDVFQKHTNELIKSLFTSQTNIREIDSNVIDQTKEEIKHLLLSNNFNINNIAEDIKDKNWDEKRIAYFLKFLKDKKTTLLVAVLQDHNSAYGEIITDFNWKIKLILGTSELKTLKYPDLQMLFAVYYKGEQKKMALDVSPNVLRKLINELENHIID